MSDRVYVPPFTTGSILNTGFGVLFSRFIPILFASILVHVPLLLFYILSEPADILAFANSQFLVIGIDLVMSFVLSGAIATLVVGALHGADTSIGSALGTGFRRIFSILGVTILLALAIGIPVAGIVFVGALLGQVGVIIFGIGAIVFALVLMAQFWVALPVTVIEREDPFSALGISADLTRGRRVSIIGALIVLAIINVAIGFIAQMVIGPVTSLEELKPAMYVGTGIGIVIGMIGAVMAAAAYYLLAAPEGRLEFVR
ncbi:MAG: hypothetical protein ACFCVH_13910 [Alphaproteobacteria bacterium]